MAVFKAKFVPGIAFGPDCGLTRKCRRPSRPSPRQVPPSRPSSLMPLTTDHHRPHLPTGTGNRTGTVVPVPVLVQ
jgi:hypothetical protein